LLVATIVATVSCREVRERLVTCRLEGAARVVKVVRLLAETVIVVVVD
jgi:hypothetical protein